MKMNYKNYRNSEIKGVYFEWADNETEKMFGFFDEMGIDTDLAHCFKGVCALFTSTDTKDEYKRLRKAFDAL